MKKADKINEVLATGTSDEKLRKAAIKAVAEDVVVQILLRNIIGEHGNYLTNNYGTCNACAIGSAIVSEYTMKTRKNFSKGTAFEKALRVLPSNFQPGNMTDKRANTGKTIFSPAELTRLEDLFESQVLILKPEFIKEKKRALEESEDKKVSESKTIKEIIEGGSQDEVRDLDHHADQSLLTIFSYLASTGGDVKKLLERFENGRRPSASQVVKMVEKIATKHRVKSKVTEGSEACDILTDLKDATIVVTNERYIIVCID